MLPEDPGQPWVDTKLSYELDLAENHVLVLDPAAVAQAIPESASVFQGEGITLPSDVKKPDPQPGDEVSEEFRKSRVKVPDSCQHGKPVGLICVPCGGWARRSRYKT